jgi:protein-tyrosine phosphatase
VFHCAAGKDRTGIVSAVILGALGVPDEIIVADYAATQENLTAIIDRLLATEGYRTVLEALPADTLHAQPVTMRTLLQELRSRHGSLRDYLRGAGLDDEVFGELERSLLEERR